MLNVTNFVIDRAIKGIMVDPANGDVLWTVSQIEDPSLKCDGEETIKNDANGTPIMSFDKAKSAEFTANSSLFDLNLAAAQFGTTKKVGTAIAKIIAPKFQTITVGETAGTANTTITLAETPYGTNPIKSINKLGSGESLGEKFMLGTATVTATTFLITGKVITLPTGALATDQFFIQYEYETDNGVEVANSAVNFPTAGEYIMQVIGSDVCSPSIKYSAYVKFPNAKLATAVDIGFTTESTHPYTIKCMQQYCDTEKKLFSIIVASSPTV